MRLPQRKPNRLKHYDYSQSGAYFVTVCTKDRRELLWAVGATFGRQQESPQLSEHGTIIKNEIEHIGEVYKHVVAVDKYVIMPNHIQMILLLHGDDGQPKVAPTISRIMQQFKGAVTKQIGFSLWQKLYHGHIVRNEQDYQKIWNYIDTNALKWEDDCFYNSRCTKAILLF